MTEASRPFTALVLAGRREGYDPVAEASGHSVKGLVPVGGMPMLARVLGALAGSRWIGRIAVISSTPESLRAALSAGYLPADVETVFLSGEATPAASVAAAAATLGAFPFLVTTADHPLLTGAMVDHFCAAAWQDCADVAVGLAAAERVLARYPSSIRTVIRFRGGSYCGCNLFAFMRPQALTAVQFWRSVERERKRPWRLARAFGPAMLLRFLLRRLTLSQAMAMAGERLRLQARAVELPFAEAAIDVDTPADLVLAERILLGSGG